MAANRWSRYVPLTGVASVLLLVVAFFIIGGSSPSVHAAGAKVIAYYQAHHSREKASDFLSVIGLILLVFFAAALRAHFGRFEGGRGPARLGYGGAIALAIGGACFASISWALADARNSIDPSAAQALNVLSNDFFWPFEVGIALYGIGFGLAAVRSRVFPLWLGWIALLLGIIGMTPLGFLAFLALLAWSLVVSVLIFLASTPASAVEARPEGA